MCIWRTLECFVGVGLGIGVVRARSYMEAGAPSDTVQGTDVIPSEEPALGSTHVDTGLPEGISTLPDLPVPNLTSTHTMNSHHLLRAASIAPATLMISHSSLCHVRYVRYVCAMAPHSRAAFSRLSSVFMDHSSLVLLCVKHTALLRRHL